VFLVTPVRDKTVATQLEAGDLQANSFQISPISIIRRRTADFASKPSG
jgi:hypothetical protein